MPRCKTMTIAEGNAINIHQYPNFHRSGSIIGMKKLYYGKDALLVRCGSWIYKVPKTVYGMAH